jgi:hypothetical protein
MQIASGVITQIGWHFTPGIFWKFITGYENVLLVMLIGYVLHFMPKSIELQAQNWVYRMPLMAKVAMMVVVVVIVVQVKSAEIQPFIYFQF